MMSEDLGALGGERPAERSDLGHVVGGAAGHGLVEQGRRVGEVDVADRFLGQPGADTPSSSS